MPEREDTEQREPVTAENAGQTDTISAQNVHDPQAATEAPPKRKAGRPFGSKERVAAVSRAKAAQILQLRAKGRSAREISILSGENVNSVKRTLSEFKDVFKELENVPQYEKVTGPLLKATELLLLKSLNDPEKISKASLNNVAYALTQANQMRRLELGQSTANVHSKQETHSTILKRSE